MLDDMLNISKTIILLSMMITFGSFMHILDGIIASGTIMPNLDAIIRILMEFLIICNICEFNIILMTNNNEFLDDYDNIIVSIGSIILRFFYGIFPIGFYCIRYVNSILIFLSLFVLLMLVIHIENICMKKIYKSLFIYLYLF